MTDNCWERIGTSGDGTCVRLEGAVRCRNCPEYSIIGRSLLDRPPPEEYLDEWTLLLSQVKEEASTGVISVFVLRLGREWLALKTGVLNEVVPLRPVHTIPHRSSPILRGIVNIRGELLLCASLAKVLAIEEAERQDAAHSGAVFGRMIVIGRGGERWVFPVDEVDRIYRIGTTALEEVPVTIAADALAYSRNIFAANGRRIALLDEESIFSALKRSLHWQATT